MEANHQYCSIGGVKGTINLHNHREITSQTKQVENRGISLDSSFDARFTKHVNQLFEHSEATFSSPCNFDDICT